MAGARHGTAGTPFGSSVPDGADREELARTLLAVLLRQIMLHGLFHAAPHPGNVMLLAAGRMAGTRQEGRRTRDRLLRPLPGWPVRRSAARASPARVPSP
ncbi:AarF/UbiB family protein [Streptosporangium roseum]|uniref:AarF/UbiB family protein n=1 Tax=Streptosporangium roseum TaxID=2001 RepID=UPI0004CDD479|nr:AarF/UbiB family protein [Streptosporangium roseum]